MNHLIEDGIVDTLDGLILREMDVLMFLLDLHYKIIIPYFALQVAELLMAQQNIKNGKKLNLNFSIYYH